MALFYNAFRCKEERAYDLCLKEAFGEKAKYGGQLQSKKVIEAAHISKHHENVVDNSFLDLNFVRQVDDYRILWGRVKRFTHIFIKVEIIDFFRRCEPHKVQSIIVEFCSVLV